MEQSVLPVMIRGVHTREDIERKLWKYAKRISQPDITVSSEPPGAAVALVGAITNVRCFSRYERPYEGRPSLNDTSRPSLSP